MFKIGQLNLYPEIAYFSPLAQKWMIISGLSTEDVYITDI